jgi:CRISPR/Cas system Type II protein with McrA/HNH and RuvC-like nuclease domain
MLQKDFCNKNLPQADSCTAANDLLIRSPRRRGEQRRRHLEIAQILIQIKDKARPKGVRLNRLEGEGRNDVRHHPKILRLR